MHCAWTFYDTWILEAGKDLEAGHLTDLSCDNCLPWLLFDLERRFRCISILHEVGARATTAQAAWQALKALLHAIIDAGAVAPKVASQVEPAAL